MTEADAGAGSRAVRVAGALVLALSAALALRVAAPAWQAAAAPDRGFQLYDNNVHAMDGIRMADALREGRPGRFLALVNARTVWPPLLPLLEVPAFVAFGPDPVTAERTMVGIGFLALVAAALAGLALGGARGVLTGALLAAFMATSPFVAGFMNEILIEGPAVLVWLVSVAFYARWVRAARAADAALCCLCGFALFMLKFNAGLLWAAPLLIAEALRAGPAAAAALGRAAGRVPLFWRIYALAVGLAAAALLSRLLDRGWGGAGLAHGVARAGSHGLTLPVVAVAALVVLPVALRPRAARGAWRAAGPFGRAFLALAVAPTLLWFAVPAHAKGLLHFLAGRTATIAMLSEEGLLFYPRIFLAEYAATPWAGAAALALALVPLAWFRRLTPAERLVPIALVVQCAMVTLHPVKADRYFYTVAPVIWMAAALGAAVLAEGAARRARRPGAAAALAPAVLAAALIAGPDAERVRAFRDGLRAPASVGPVLDAIADVNAASQGTVLFGTWNGLAPELAEWRQRLRHPGRAAPPRPRNPSWFGTAEPGALLDAIAGDPGIERVIVLDLPPGHAASSPYFAFETDWQGPARAALAADPRFVTERRTPFAASGYVMTVYGRRPAVP